MQPPLSAHLRERIQQLAAQAAARDSRTQQTGGAELKREERRARRCTDYVGLIREWMSAIPPALLDRPYLMAEIVCRFHGRYSALPAPRMIAAALRQLGWTSHRNWTRAGRNTRYWRPPTEAEMTELPS